MTETLTRNNEQEKLVQSYIEVRVPQEIEADVMGAIDLPDGVGVLGGAARNIAWQLLRDEQSPPLRDIDIAFLDIQHKMEADELSNQLNPRDSEHGHGAQQIANIEEYMHQRDFTINQVLYVDGILYITPEAMDHIIDGVIQPTEYEHHGEWQLSGKLRLKGYLLETVMRAEGHNATFNDPLEQPGEPVEIGHTFFKALILQKALEYGGDVADKFYERLGWKQPNETLDYGRMMIKYNHQLAWPFIYSPEACSEAGLDVDLVTEAIQNIFDDGADTPAVEAIDLTGERDWSSWLEKRALPDDTIEDIRTRMTTYSGRGSQYIDD